MISQGEGCREDVGGGDGSTHVKRSKNHQRQSFIPLGHISRVTVMYLHPEGRGKTAGSNALGAFLVLFFFWWSLAPDLCLVKTILGGNLRSFSVYSPEFS